MILANLTHHPSRVLAACFLVALSGCASNKALDNQLANSREAVDQAQAAGAAETAPADLDHAVGKLNRADDTAKNGDKDEAMRLAQQAQADANVARARTDAIQARTAASELAKSNVALREEISRANQKQQR